LLLSLHPNNLLLRP